MNAPPANPLGAMFEWWNQAYATGQLTAEGFGCHFSQTATLRVNGALRARGLDGLVKPSSACRRPRMKRFRDYMSGLR